MAVLTLTSDLAAPAPEVWAHATSMAGIDAELRPWLSMRPPHRWRGASIADLPLGVRLGRALILLGGLLPVECDDLRVTEHEPGRMFQERSSLLTVRSWTHRRTVVPLDGGCRLTDVVGVEARLQLLDPMALQAARLVFIHRHRRLAALFGPGSR